MAQATQLVQLDPDLASIEAQEIEDVLRSRIVGQDRAINKLVGLYDVIQAELTAPTRPLGVLLFCGPSGSGKTATAYAMAEALHGDPKKLMRIDCAEYQHDHETAKLVGAPPGYLGFNSNSDNNALLTQITLDKLQSPKHDFSMVLFDEIEKASPAMWRMLLGIFDNATLTLGNNAIVSFSKTLIFLTSNIGTRETNRTLMGGMGFTAQAASVETADKQIYSATKAAAERAFPPEFMNRVDRLIVFRSLTREELVDVLRLELKIVQNRIIAAGHQVVLIVDALARDLLLSEGTDAKFGARHLRRAIERFLNAPLSRLLATEQVASGTALYVSAEGGKLTFSIRTAASE